MNYQDMVDEGVAQVLAAQRSSQQPPSPQPRALPTPIGLDTQLVRGDMVLEGAAIVENWKRSQQTGFFKGVAGDVGRGVISVAQPGMLIASMMGKPGMKEALALSQRVKKNLWQQYDPTLAEMVAHATVETLPAMVPDFVAGVAGGAVAGPVGAPIGFGLSAGLRSAAESAIRSFEEAGVDVQNPVALSAAFNTPEIMAKAGKSAAKHGLTDAAFAAATAALAGPVGKVAESISKAAPAAVRTATKLGTEAALMGDIAAGQTIAHNAMDGRPLLDSVAESTLAGVAQGPVLAAGLRATGISAGENAAKKPADLSFLDQWVKDNPDRAKAIADADSPSRTTFKKNGFPVTMEGTDRARAQERIAAILRGEPPTEPTPDPTPSPDPTTPSPDDPSGPKPDPAAETPPKDAEAAPRPATPEEALQNRAREILDSGESIDLADATEQAKIEFARLERQDANKAESEDPAPPWAKADQESLRERAPAAEPETPARLIQNDATVLPDEAINATEPVRTANNRAAAPEGDPAQTRPYDSAPGAAPSATTRDAASTPNEAARLSANPLRFPYAGPKVAPPEKGLSAPSVVRWMSDTFQVPIRNGKIAQTRALGIYKRLPQIIRLRGEEAANIEVAAHETGHHLDRNMGIDSKNPNYWSSRLPNPVRNELATLDYGYPKQKRPYEGFAEYIAATTQGHDMSKRVPKFDAYWKNYLTTQPELAQKLSKMSELVRNFESQDPLQAIKSHMSETGQPRDAVDKPFLERAGDYLKDLGRRAIVQIFDTNYDLKLFDERAKKQAARLGKAEPEDSAYILGREAIRSAPTAGLRALEHGAYRLSDPAGPAIGPKMADFFEAIGDAPRADVEAFAVARHAISARARGIETGLRPGDAQAVYDRFKDDARFVKGADVITKINDALIDVMVDQRLLSPEDARAMRTAWGDNYVPLLRARETEPSPGNPEGVKSGGAYRRRVGSGAEILSPLAATARKYAQVYRDAYVANLKNTIIDTATKTDGMGWASERLPTPKKVTEFQLADIAEQLVDAGVDPQALMNADPEALLQYFKPDAFAERDPNIFRRKEITGHVVETLLDGTQRETPKYGWVNYKVDPDIALAVHSISNIVPQNLFHKFLSLTNAPVRALATTNNPAWAVRNAIKDAQTHAMQNSAPFAQALLEIPREHIRSILRKAGKADPIHDLFDRLRGETSMADADRNVSTREIDRAWGDPKRSILSVASAGYSAIKAPGQHIEMMPRIAEFRRTLVEAGYDNVAIGSGRRPPAKLVWKALHNAAEVTTDFASRGRDGTIRAALFGNAMAQGAYRWGRNFTTKEAAARSLPRVAALMMISAALWGVNHNSDAWKEMPAWAKYSYIPIMHNGKPLLRIGIAQDWGMVHALTTAGLDSASDGSFAPLRDALKEQGSRLAASPAILGWAYQQATNQDAWGRPIENAQMKGVEAKDRYNPGTTQASRYLANDILGNALGISPTRLEHTLDSLSAGLYRYSARSVEMGLGLGDDKPTPVQLRDVPVAGGFAFGTDPSKSVQAFYDARNKQTQKTGSLELRGVKSGPEFDRQAELTRYGEVIKGLRETIKDERDRDTRFAVEKYIIGLSRRAVGEKELDRYPDPFMHPPEDPKLRAVVDKAVALEAAQATKARPQRGKNETAADHEAEITKWQAEIAQSRAFLKATGYTPEQIKAALVAHHRARGSNTAVLRDGKLTTFGEQLRLLSQPTSGQ